MTGTPDPPTAKGAIARAVTLSLVCASLLLAAGLLEAGYRWAGEPLSPRMPPYGYEFLWIAPLGLLVFCAPLVAAVALGHAVRPKWVTVPRALFVVSAPAFFGLSVMVLRERLPDAVHLILALGFASVLMRSAEGRERRFARVGALAFPILLLVPLVALAVYARWRVDGGRAAIAQLPPAPPGARNVLLIVWDTVRERELSLYGYHLPVTPNLDRRAGRGVVFDRAYSTAPWTLPSHASLFTGHWRQDLSTDWITPLDGEHPTLAEVLAGYGYRTAGFTANLGATDRYTGLARGFHRYEDRPLRRVGNVLSQVRLVRTVMRFWPFRTIEALRLPFKDSETVTTSFLAWLDRAPGADRPFFVFLNYFDAHFPYRTPPAFRGRFPGGTLQAKYDEAIAHQDYELERLLTELDGRGLLDGTVVAFTADHGEAFGDHDYWGHGNYLYDEQVHVPLVVWAPGRIPEGARVAAPVSIRDIPSTLLELALDDPPAGALGGRSLSRHWDGSLPGPDTIVAGARQAINDSFTTHITYGDASAVIVDRFHYVLTGRGEEELYDHDVDPLQLHNLADVDSLRPMMAAMRRYLRANFDSSWSHDSTPAGGLDH